jgi:hypothetical protein
LGVVALVGSLLLLPATASASPSARVSASLPGTVLANSRIVVAGRVAGARSVALQAKQRGAWAVLARVRLHSSHRRFALHWRTPRNTGAVLLRVVALRHGKIIARSSAGRVVVSLGRFKPGTAAVVGQPTTVSSLPAPGSFGTLILNGFVNIEPGQVLAFGYSKDTPDGFLGQVTAVLHVGSQTILQTRPATLMEAGAHGSLDLSTFHEVLPSGAIDPHPLGAFAHIASSSGFFNHGLGKNFSCSDGASASLTGQVSVSITPAFHADISLFHGLQSASFTLTGNANASLTAKAEASAGCALSQTELLAEPIHIATFVGAIGAIPVVIVLQAQIYVDASMSGKAQACSSVSAGVSMTGGIGYSNGSFAPILSGPTTSFNFQPPTASANASAGANVEPALQMLLYGVGGPQLGIKAGLAFNADTNANPWWTLTAPLSLEASLVAPSLGLDSGSLTLFSHEFGIADAGGPFGYAIPGSC